MIFIRIQNASIPLLAWADKPRVYPLRTRSQEESHDKVRLIPMRSGAVSLLCHYNCLRLATVKNQHEQSEHDLNQVEVGWTQASLNVQRTK